MSASRATRTERSAGTIEDHLGSRDVARVIYGAIIGLALVVALEDHPPAPGAMAATVAGTALAVGLAEAYSEIVGAEARTRKPVHGAGVRVLLLDGVAVTFGAGFPALFFVLAAAGVMDTDLAFTLSKWTGLGLIGSTGSSLPAYPDQDSAGLSCTRPPWAESAAP